MLVTSVKNNPGLTDVAVPTKNLNVDTVYTFMKVPFNSITFSTQGIGLI